MVRVVLSLLIGFTALQASPFFSTFGPNNGYSSNSFSLDAGDIAVSFVPTVTEVLQSANVEAYGTSLTVEIVGGSSPAGPVVDTMSTVLKSQAAFVTLTSLNDVTLVAGNEYWIVLAGNASMDESVASYNLATNNAGIYWEGRWYTSNSGSSPLPAIALNGTSGVNVGSTPEPSTFGLAFGAIALLGAVVRRSRAQPRS